MSTRIAASDIAENLTAQGAEAAALGALVKMSVRKRLLIRAIELIVRPIVLALQRLRGRPRNIVGESKKILVIEYWNLGDIVMLSPFLRSLRIQYPDARITSICDGGKFQAMCGALELVIFSFTRRFGCGAATFR